MWWFRATLLSLALAACGFTPVYGPGGGTAVLGAIRAQEPNSQIEFAFVEAIETRLGLPASPRYDLLYNISVEEEGRAITGSNDITRFTVDGVLTYRVRPVDDPEAEDVLTGRVQSFTSYSASGSSIATFQAKRDAEARLMQILADRLAERLVAAPELR